MLRPEQERELDHLLSSLGPADAPPDLVDAVLARISSQTHTAAAQPEVHPFVRRSVPKRGVTVNKKIIFALAAAAVVVLAVITYTSRPATTGTEATIGTAQRAQTPQIAAKDVGLADQSGQDLLQSDTWDAIMKDEDLQATLHDAEARKLLEDADVRKALESDAVRRGLLDPELIQRIKAQVSSAGKKAALTDYEAKSFNSAAARAAVANESFARALRGNTNFARALLNARWARALSGDAMARAVRDQQFARALANPRFGEELARRAKK